MKKCPIKNSICFSDCAWYIEEYNSCAVIGIAALAGVIEDLTKQQENSSLIRAWSEE